MVAAIGVGSWKLGFSISMFSEKRNNENTTAIICESAIFPSLTISLILFAI